MTLSMWISCVGFPYSLTVFCTLLLSVLCGWWRWVDGFDFAKSESDAVECFEDYG